jgi:hypothetical protein
MRIAPQAHYFHADRWMVCWLLASNPSGESVISGDVGVMNRNFTEKQG